MPLLRQRSSGPSGPAHLLGVLLLLALVPPHSLQAQWRLSRSRDEMTDAETVTLRLPGTPTSGRFGGGTPYLSLRCKGDTFEGFLTFPWVVDTDDDGDVPIRTRFDARPAEKYFLTASTSHRGGFFDEPTAWVNVILESRVLRVEVGEAFGSPRLTRFALAGLVRLLRRLPCLTVGETSDPPADTTAADTTVLSSARPRSRVGPHSVLDAALRADPVHARAEPLPGAPALFPRASTIEGIADVHGVPDRRPLRNRRTAKDRRWQIAGDNRGPPGGQSSGRRARPPLRRLPALPDLTAPGVSRCPAFSTRSPSRATSSSTTWAMLRRLDAPGTLPSRAIRAAPVAGQYRRRRPPLERAACGRR